MPTFRPVPDGDRTRLEEILRYAFNPQQGPISEDSEEEWPPTLFDQHGLYAEGNLVSTCKLYFLDACVRGDVQQIGGLGAVATPPEHRRQGYVRDLCRNALAAFEESGAGLVTLWPFETSFYANLGWATANKITEYRCPPHVLPRHDAEGRMRRLDADDWERLQSVERAHGEGVSLSLRRSEQWWRERTLTSWTGGPEPYIYGYERDGEIAGLLTYSVADDETETLSVATFMSADEESDRAILSFLGTHGAQVERIQFTRREESDLLDRVREPEQVDCELHAGPMVRLTSVGALEEYSWPAGDFRCSLTVDDPLENDESVFELTISEGDATVTEAGTDPADTDIALGIGPLSQLVVGTHSVETLTRLGKMAIRDEQAAEELASVFNSQAVALGEFF